ncbi:MAG TPA: hypothetical protein VGP96_12035 [Candidatus Dormibacteraeota bacterium]|nr:hypothetical protein [Candidatus Dormibacteraeota bacterium]
MLDDVRSAGGDMLVVDGRRLPWREGARHHIETASGRGRMGEAVR